MYFLIPKNMKLHQLHQLSDLGNRLQNTVYKLDLTMSFQVPILLITRDLPNYGN